MSRIGTASPSARLWKINPCQAYKRKDRLRKAVFSFYISLSKNSCKRPEEALLQEQKTQGLFPKFPVVARKPCDEVGFGTVPEKSLPATCVAWLQSAAPFSGRIREGSGTRLVPVPAVVPAEKTVLLPAMSRERVHIRRFPRHDGTIVPVQIKPGFF